MKDSKLYPSYEEYGQPKKNVLVISCIDLRLTDNLLEFLHFDNLINRYDHVAMAGASLCGSYKKNQDKFHPEAVKKYKSIPHWENALMDHVQIAYDLHDIGDIYIVEHEDCGAYKKFLKQGEVKDRKKEMHLHKKYADDLTEKIRAKLPALNVHSFILDLRGNVRML